MSPAGLFAMGVLVTLLYGAGLSLLVYGAILDGRDEARRKAEEADQARAGRRAHPVPHERSARADDRPAAA